MPKPVKKTPTYCRENPNPKTVEREDIPKDCLNVMQVAAQVPPDYDELIKFARVLGACCKEHGERRSCEQRRT